MPRGKFLENPTTQKMTKSGFFWFVALLFVAAFGMKLTEQMTVSSTVDGRELPIYCVQTEEKKVALSFDAAWGNEDTKQILDILKKHNVNVTFFMTGGWVDKCACMKKLKYCGKPALYKLPFRNCVALE